MVPVSISIISQGKPFGKLHMKRWMIESSRCWVNQGGVVPQAASDKEQQKVSWEDAWWEQGEVSWVLSVEARMEGGKEEVL